MGENIWQKSNAADVTVVTHLSEAGVLTAAPEEEAAAKDPQAPRTQCGNSL